MNKNTAQIIKEVRKNNNLTQKQFAKKFFITEKTVSNYENGERSPSFEFLAKLCKEFNLSMDYFINQEDTIESDPKDLEVYERKGKVALYNKKLGRYLTQYIYDVIIISKTGPHVVLKCGKELRENGATVASGKILYSAVVDNFGKLHEFPDIEFSYNSEFKDGVSIATSKKDGKEYLVNTNGDFISKGYKDIVFPCTIHKCYGLYLGCEINYDEKGYYVSTSNPTLLYKNGEEIDLKLHSTEFDPYDRLHRAYIATDLTSIETIVEHIEKYGPNIIQFVPTPIFEVVDNYYKIIEAANRYSLKEYDNSKKFYAIAELTYAVETLWEYAKNLDLQYSDANKKIILPNKEHYVGNKYSPYRHIERLYRNIGLI